jgi:hypothetical protein
VGKTGLKFSISDFIQIKVCFDLFSVFSALGTLAAGRFKVCGCFPQNRNKCSNKCFTLRLNSMLNCFVERESESMETNLCDFYRTTNSSNHARLSEAHNSFFPVRVFACPTTSRTYYKTPCPSDNPAHISEAFSLLAVRCTVWRQFPSPPPCHCENAAAAESSLIVAAYVQYGGCSRTSRRFLRRKIRKSAPSSRIPAAHFGDKLANLRQSRH